LRGQSLAKKSPEIALVPVAEIPAALPVADDQLVQAYVMALKLEWLCDREGGLGLSAVQAGSTLDLFVVKRKGGSYEHYINCRYEGLGEMKKAIEGCLSIRSKDGRPRNFEVDRYPAARVTGRLLRVSERGEPVAEEVDFVVEGLPAVVFQHEIDHSLGFLISDKGREIEVF